MQPARRPYTGPARPTWLLAAALAASASMTGCAPPSAEPPATGAAAEHAPTSNAAPPSEPPSANPQGAPAAGQPRVSVDQVKGGSIEYARAILAPTALTMKECRTRAPTAIRVRITSDERGAALHVEPGSAVDGAIRRCVLEALSTIELPDTAPRGNGPPPSGFSSLVTVEW